MTRRSSRAGSPPNNCSDPYHVASAAIRPAGNSRRAHTWSIAFSSQLINTTISKHLTQHTCFSNTYLWGLNPPTCCGLNVSFLLFQQSQQHNSKCYRILEVFIQFWQAYHVYFALDKVLYRITDCIALVWRHIFYLFIIRFFVFFFNINNITSAECILVFIIFKDLTNYCDPQTKRNFIKFMYLFKQK